MDLLIVPADPAFSTDPSPYICSERWDGGPFLTYAYRKGKSRVIPPSLVRPPEDQRRPYLELLDPTPQEHLQDLYQTWFFFGLLAEFLGLNTHETGERVLDATRAQRELADLYKTSVFIQDGKQYLTGAMVLTSGPLILSRIRHAGSDATSRITELFACLQFTYTMLNIAIHSPFDDSIKYSIAALGELLMTTVQMSMRIMNIPAHIVSGLSGFPWYHNYIKQGGRLEERLLAEGWCRSELEKVKQKYQGLNTVHFLSRLRKVGQRRDHTLCDNNRCVAFQINNITYRTAHAHVDDGRECHQVEVSLGPVRVILSGTASYPLLNVQPSATIPGDVDLLVEAFQPGVPYVAISHVWADGLGNPTHNALPACQIKRLAHLVSRLQDLVEPSGSKTSYRLWIDTLCCPVEINGKMIALQRIADVYRNATHVLVLDASLIQCISEQLDPAEVMLRILGTSTWMRRLWTFQDRSLMPLWRSAEGALATSLYFQYSDRPIKGSDLLPLIYEMGLRDARYLRLWIDIQNELNYFNYFTRSHSSAVGIEPPSPIDLELLQRALNFRTVSVPSDEPLCIATLLTLDIAYVVAAGDDADVRMARVWELIARAYGGVPAALALYNSNPIQIPGWRWAPRSLLSGSEESAFDVGRCATRFHGAMAQPTSKGLRAAFPGYLVRPVPRAPGLTLDPWNGVVAGVGEDVVYLHDKRTGKWFMLSDYHRTHSLTTWTVEYRDEWDKKMGKPLRTAIHTGRSALVMDVESAVGSAVVCLMVLIGDDDGGDEVVAERDAGGVDGSDDTGSKHEVEFKVEQTARPLKVVRQRLVILSEANTANRLVANTVVRIADAVGKEQVTANLQDQDLESEGRKIALQALQARMKELMAETWAANTDFAQAARMSLSDDIEELMWASIAKDHSYSADIESLPDDQVWLID